MAKTYSRLLVGVEALSVEIETVLGSGFSGLNILGLNTEATRDMRERIRSALESVGVPIPARRIVVNITPSEVTKFSRTSLAQLDFAVAASILYALFEENEQTLCQPENEFLGGELSLSGELKEISNSLIYETIFLLDLKEVALCLPNYASNKLISLLNSNANYFKSLAEWLAFRKQKNYKNQELQQDNKALFFSSQKLTSEEDDEARVTRVIECISLLIKNPKLCVSLLIAALRSHHILIAGEPGVGKSFVLQKLSLLLSPLTEKEKLKLGLSIL